MRISQKNGELIQIVFSIAGEKNVIEAEQLLVATERKPNTEALNLQAAGVEVGPKNDVKVNNYLQTANTNIYAAGDVILGPQFVYVNLPIRVELLLTIML